MGEITGAYGWDLKLCSIEKIEAGHIHHSYRLRITFDTPKSKRSESFFLQKINTAIFEHPDAVMSNIQKVCSKIKSISDPKFSSLTIVPDRNGSLYFNSSRGESYRIFNFLEGYRSISQQASTNIIKQVGSTFGKFIAALENEKTDEYNTTLPDFHNINFRLSQLEESRKIARIERLKLLQQLFEIVLSLQDECKIIQQLIDQRLLPIRICHNDTKGSNIMYNMSQQSYCVVDLDTVMPSSLLFDFGDAIRSIISGCGEDDIRDNNEELKWHLVSAFSEGFFGATKHFMTDLELKHLANACILLPYMMGVRFLTDYLNDNLYFSISYNNQNLDRARNQLELAQQISRERTRLEGIIEKALTS